MIPVDAENFFLSESEVNTVEPLSNAKAADSSSTALKALIDEAVVELHSEKFQYAKRTTNYIEVTWRQFLSYCDFRCLEEYLPKYKDEFIADLCSRTPPLKASTVERKDSHMKMLDLFARNGTWEKGDLNPLQELPPEFNAYLDEQEKHLAKIGRSECTCRTMREQSYRILRCFQNEGLKKLADIDESHISSFVLSLKGHARSTVRCELSRLRILLSNLYLMGIIPADLSVHVPRYNLGHQQSIVKIWQSSEINTVLETVDRTSPKGKRDAAYITIAAELGVRSGDIRSLKCSDIDWELCSISFVQSKTGKTNVLPLNEKVGAAIIDYLRVRPKTDCEYLFVSLEPPYGKMRSFNTAFENYVYRSGVNIPVSAHHGLHSLRASVATKLLAAGVNPDTIFSFLGHSDRESLNSYLRLDIENLRECALSFEDGELI